LIPVTCRLHRRSPRRGAAHLALYLAGGWISLLLLRSAWGAYWRRREYAADRYALELGGDLARVLECHALFFDAPVPFLWLFEHVHRRSNCAWGA